MSSKNKESNGEQETSEQPYARETWSTKVDFLLACIGFSVGLGNVWRFPYLCYKNGGGAFLIPYFICVFVGGIPLFYLEVAVGQFMGTSGTKAWQIAPILQGIGITSLIIVFFLDCYYNVILCWAFYYMFSSFTSKLPWTECNNWWNTDRCYEFNSDNTSAVIPLTSNNQTRLDPVTEFWEKKVLKISDGIEHMGEVKWDLALCLLWSWIVVYVCICKGIKSSGKVMYVTATSPYIFMLALLIRNSLLDGAKEGVIFYLKPDIEKLKSIEVWVDAGTQVFFSYSIALGTLTALGSYNKFNHNAVRDALIFAGFNSGTSFFAGFIIFTILGHMAEIQNTTVDKVAASGPGLAFIAYPKAVSLMPGAPAWSVLFFLMVVLLGLDSQFVGVEGVITVIVDAYPHILRKGYRKEIFIAVVCGIMYLVGLSMVAEGGMYVFQLFDYYSGSRIILFIGFFECLAVAYVYGISRFNDNIRMMMGNTILTTITMPYMTICWLLVSPIFCMAIFIMSVINYSELDYRRPDGVYKYPNWAVGIGWAMAGFGAIWIPLTAVYHVVRLGLRSPGDLCLLFRPYGLEEHQLRPNDRGQRSLSDVFDKKNVYLESPGIKMEQNTMSNPKMEHPFAHDNIAFSEEARNTHL